VQPVVSDPGGQHCVAMVTLRSAQVLVFDACIWRRLPELDIATSAVNPGMFISDISFHSNPRFHRRQYGDISATSNFVTSNGNSPVTSKRTTHLSTTLRSKRRKGGASGEGHRAHKLG
jgi:hypothetical protein